MEAFSPARFTRGLAGAMSLAVVITCASPTSPTSSYVSSELGSNSALRSGTYIDVWLADSSIAVGDSTTASAILRTIWGGEWHWNRVTWSTNNAAVATVDASGKVRGVTAGTANIIAKIDGGLAPVAIVVAGAPQAQVATQLGITTQPGGGLSGANLAPQPVVEIRDANNLLVPASTSPVTATITGAGGTLFGTTTVMAIAGVVSFTNLGITGSGTYTLTFAAAGLTSAASNAFTITTPPATQLAMVTQPPSSAASGAVFVPQPAVRLRDASNNPVGQAGVNVTAAIASGGGTLGGTVTTTTDATGLATFTNLSITGSAGTRTLSFTAPSLIGATSNAILITTTPSATGVLFQSDWSTATGATDAALMDASKALPWNLRGGSGLEVVASTGLNFPTANVLRVTALQANSGFALLRRTGLPVPAVGESRYYRWYTRVVIGDEVAASDNETHPHQDGNAGSQCNWSFNIHHDLGPAGTWTPQFRTASLINAWPNHWWTGPTLSKNVTYRFELQVHRIGTTTFNMHVRIYNSSGLLLHDDAAFRNDNNTVTLASRPTLNLNAAANMDGLNAGLNGLAGSEWFPSVVYMYQGGVAVCADNWCGPYVP